LPRLSLLGKFAVASLIPIVALGVALGRVLEVQIRNQALSNAKQSAALVARLGIQPQLSAADLSRGLTTARYRSLDAALRGGFVGREVARVKIWSRDYRVVYSDDPALVGRTFPSSDELDEALHGEIASEVSDLTKEENVGDRSFGQLLEVYVPLTFEGDQRPAGAFEIYLPYRPIEAAIARDSHRLYLVLLAGLAFLYAALFRIVAAASKRLRRQAARELRLANEERDLALRKAAVIATVSHEFRTPLTIIQGVSKTLDGQGLVAEAGRPLVESLGEAGRRLDDLVAAVLAAAEGVERESRVAWSPVDLTDLCRELADGLATIGGPERVRFTPEGGSEIIVTDRAMVRAILRHLVENALKFSPADSPVDVSSANVIDGVEIRVRDRGPGISPAFLQQAFDPFTQEDQSSTRAKQGLGIGLFAARKLVELLNGRVDLQPHPEGGMEAIVRLRQRGQGRPAISTGGVRLAGAPSLTR
jgi:signal transduction histidine kinase